MNEGPM